MENIAQTRHRVLTDECRFIVQQRVGTPIGVAYSAIVRMFSPLDRWQAWKDYTGIDNVERELAIREGGRTW